MGGESILFFPRYPFVLLYASNVRIKIRGLFVRVYTSGRTCAPVLRFSQFPKKRKRTSAMSPTKIVGFPEIFNQVSVKVDYTRLGVRR